MTDDFVPALVDGVHVLVLEGELDAISAPLLEPGLLDLVSAAVPLLVDLDQTTFFDSAGVRLIDRLRRRCGSQGVALRVVAPVGSMPRRVLEIVGMLGGLVVDTTEQGMAELRLA